MKGLWLAMRFLAATQLRLRREHSLQVRTYTAGGRPVVCDVYMPARSHGTVVTLNGFAPPGSRDPRIIAVNEALVYAGFTVVSPTIQEICEYKIDPRHIGLINELLREIAADESLRGDGSVSVLAPSFSGSLCMLAAFQAPKAPHFKALCMIGSYADAEDTLGTVFLDPRVDEYGRLILLKNFAHWAMGRLPGMERALRDLLHDNYYQPSVPAFAARARKLHPRTRTALERLRTQEKFRAAQWNKILRNGHRARSVLGRLCLIQNARPVNTAVTLIHGRDDSVVPARQSRMLHGILRHHGVRSRLVVTPLISHGDSQFSLSQIPAVADLWRGFAHFLEAAASRAPDCASAP